MTAATKTETRIEIVRLAYLTRDDFGFTLWVSPADNEWPAVPSWTVVKRGKGTTAKSLFKDRSGENLEFPLMMTDVEQLYPEALRLVPNSSATIPLRLTFHQDLKASEAFHPEWSDNP